MNGERVNPEKRARIESQLIDTRKMNGDKTEVSQEKKVLKKFKIQVLKNEISNEKMKYEDHQGNKSIRMLRNKKEK